MATAKRGPGRPRSPAPAQTLGFRLPPDLIARLDRYVARIAEVVPSANRTDAVRALLDQALRKAGL